MALSLTCVCGARFEVEDTLAGQEVSCPECQQPLRAPSLQRPPLRTSDCALASVVLATAGAFTVVGTVAAVGLGVAALVLIRRHRDRVTGAGLAVAGIVLGTLFTALTVLALSPGELFGLGGWWRERNLRGLVDRSGPLEIDRPAQGYRITRPSPRWGRVVEGKVLPDPFLAGLQQDCDLLLVEPARAAYIDVRVDDTRNGATLDQCQESVLAEFQRPLRFDPDGEDRPFRRPSVVTRTERLLPGGPNYQAKELDLDAKGAGQVWRLIVRLYKVNAGPLYVVRGYTQKRHLRAAEAELLRGLDSFHILGGP